MKPWEQLDETSLPDGQVMSLHRRGQEYVIRVAGQELMNSRMHGSEDGLGELGCEPIAKRAAPRVLIGGLGMGFTLAAALKVLPADAELVVAELVEAVVDWNRQELAHLNQEALKDGRVQLHLGDVAELIASEQARFDAILLDVDNGPEGLTQGENDRLYGEEGLRRARGALRSGGVLAVWSVSEDAAFTRRLKRSRFRVEILPVRAHGKKGRRHFIWRATKKGE